MKTEEFFDNYDQDNKRISITTNYHRSSLAKISIAIAITAAPPESKVKLLTELQIISTTLEKKTIISLFKHLGREHVRNK